MNVQLRSRDHRRRLVVGGITYLLLDQFTTNAVAPLASPRTCEPGPGTLTLVQTDGEFSIVSSALNFPAQGTPVYGDQGFYGGSIATVAGRALLCSINQSTLGAVSGIFVAFKLAADVNTSVAGGARFFISSSAVEVRVGVETVASFVVAPPLSAGTLYQYALVLRNGGCFHLIKGGIYTEWTLLWVSSASIGDPLYPVFSNYDAAGTMDNLRVTDLPSPWTDDYGIATQRLAGALTPASTFVHEADCLIEYTATTLPTAGTATRLAFRKQDANNFWWVYTNNVGLLDLVERAAGVDTIRGTAGNVVLAGHRVVIICSGTTIRVYSNNTLRITYASATNFQTETDGDNSLTDGGTISDLIAWPRTLSGTALSTLSAV